jgi:DNA-binding transcriptional ArsR family regulator
VSKFSVLRDILALADITAQQKLVLVAMNQYGDSQGRNIYPAIETVAKLASLSARQVRRHIKTLRQLGYLSPQGKGRNNTTRYTLSVPTSRTPVSQPGGHPRPTNTLNNPLTSPEEERDSYFNAGSGWSGDSQPRYHRRTRQELIEKGERERKARQARLAGDHRPKA